LQSRHVPTRATRRSKQPGHVPANRSWRLAIDEKYPDRRNARSAKLLKNLAGEAAHLSDEQFAALDFQSGRWNDCLRKASRQVGYFYKKASFPFFLRSLIRLLDEPAIAGG
jgi:hypothetical protein